MIDVLNKIRDVLDPNHIGYKAGEARLEPEAEDEEKGYGYSDCLRFADEGVGPRNLTTSFQ
jgi:hypothetical protein